MTFGEGFDPLHDQEVGGSPVLGGAGGWGFRGGLGFVEVGELEAGLEQGLHVRTEGPVVVLDVDAAVGEPHGALVHVIIDAIVLGLPLPIPDPAAVSTGRVEAVEVRNEERTAGLEDPGHFRDGGGDVWNVDEAEVADYEVE